MLFSPFSSLQNPIDVLFLNFALVTRKVIENNGGKLEKIVFDEISQKNICRYCITLNENIYPRTA